jgi:hypothetical protein
MYCPLQDLIHEKGRSLSEWIHVGGVKAFLDGSLGSSSALFYEVNGHELVLNKYLHIHIHIFTV